MMLSIVIPAYKEHKNIQKTIQVVERFLKKQDFMAEVLVIADGCNLTFEEAKKYNSDITRIYFYSPNQGKGYALKYGSLRAKGDYIVFFDAGLDFPVTDITRALTRLQISGKDIAIGSKRHAESDVIYPFKRKVLSFAGQLLIKTLFGMNVKDTQVGLKIFKREALHKIMKKVVVKRYAFDIELLALANHYGYTILEIPVTLHLNFSHSGVNAKAITNCLIDALGVFYRLHILKFYDRSRQEREVMLSKYMIYNKTLNTVLEEEMVN